MLVRITNRCRMGCRHCMINAAPDGEHMSLKTFEKVVDLIHQHQLMLLMVSGGEPLEHPQFFELMDLAKDIPIKTILSNGMFLEDPATKKKVLDLGIPLQITNDPRYYPKRIPKVDHSLLGYETHIQTITALGRAKDNDIPTNRLAPMCFNLRSLVRKYGFWDSVIYLRSMKKLCIPSINIDGSIIAGESSCCHRIGTIESSDQELVQNLQRMDCNCCGMEDALSPIYRQAIGVS